MSKWRRPGKARLKNDLGLECVSPDEALKGAEVVILAVPDTHIGKVAAGINDRLQAGTMVVALDAAAPFAGHLPARPDLTYFVTHPCHPPIFNDETDIAAKRDHFGGLLAKQHIVSALMQGPESALCTGRGDRQGDLGAGDALASRHCRADGAARTRSVRNGLRDFARRHARGDGRGGEPRRAARSRARLPARPS